MAKTEEISNEVKASFDITTQEGQFKVFNAQNGSSVSMKKMESGEIIEAVGIMQYRDVTDSYGKQQEVTITVIFAEDGQSYAGVSDTVAKAGEKLIELVTKLKLEKFRVVLTKQFSEKGNEFLNLRLVL
jgi:hypothetical protein